MELCNFSCLGGITIYTKQEIKKFLSIIYDIEGLAHKGNQEAMCIYIDIKSAFNQLPSMYKIYVNNRFILQDKTVPIRLANKGIKLMEDYLNGR